MLDCRAEKCLTIGRCCFKNPFLLAFQHLTDKTSVINLVWIIIKSKPIPSRTGSFFCSIFYLVKINYDGLPQTSSTFFPFTAKWPRCFFLSPNQHIEWDYVWNNDFLWNELKSQLSLQKMQLLLSELVKMKVGC